MILRALACAGLIALCLAAPRAFAGTAGITETLNLVWEVFWQQQGYLQPVSKWRDPIRVSFSGVARERHKRFALGELLKAARAAGLDLAEADPAGPPANFEVEFVADDLTRVGFYFACRTVRTPAAGVVRRVKIIAEERSLRGCMLHEAMHALGMVGHPRGGSILSYYRGSSELTANDRFMLEVWYSDEVLPGMSPLAALAVFARRLVEALPPEQQAEARRAAAQFQREAFAQLEAIALGKGEPPRILFQSSTLTRAGLARGRIEAQRFVGAPAMQADR
ncbi:MAG TPA: hypothetical protein VGF58_15755 [Burkholderiales bacterium]